MAALIHYFWRLCRLQAVPQDLPPSRGLLATSLLLYLAVGWLLEYITGDFAEDSAALITAAGGTAVMVVLINLLLAVAQKPERAVQTLTALAGSQVVIGLVAWLLHLLLGDVAQGRLILPQLMLLLWSIAVIAHILRHALSTSLGWGMVAAMGYLLMSLLLLAPLYQSLA